MLTAAAEIRETRRLITALKVREARRSDATASAVRHDWYAPGCPCGVPPGECREHPRARPLVAVGDRSFRGQRPPDGDWRTWLLMMGRGSGKTRAGAEWVRHQVETGRCRRVALVGATAADVRDIMIEGAGGLLSVCPPSNRPHYEPSKRRLTWPNGAIATAYSADEPDRLRGPQHDGAWADEVAAWRRSDAWSNLLFGLRLGGSPRVCVTTTPRAVSLVQELVDDPTTVVSRDSSHSNRLHLAPDFFSRVISTYEGTRLGQQEIYGELLQLTEGAWFRSFDPTRHMTELAEYHPGYPVLLAIDHGVSSFTGAVWLQVRPVRPLPCFDTPSRVEAILTPGGWTMPQSSPPRRVPDPSPRETVCVFGDFIADGPASAEAARAVQSAGGKLPPCAGTPDLVRLDPYGVPSTGMGVTAYREFEAAFGPKITARWPGHRVRDGLDQVEVLLESGRLLIHPRCEKLKAAFQNYSRRRNPSGGYLDEPADPQHPHEDVLDALRGGIRDRFPGGRVEQPKLRTVHA